MVAFRNISAYDAPTPAGGGGTKILGGPLYSLEDLKAEAKRDVSLWTRKCIQDVRDLGFDKEDVVDLIQELTSEDYRDSEWCRNGTGKLIAACDAYKHKRRETCEATGGYIDIEYFLKFTMRNSGCIVLIVSCHLSS